MFAFVTVTPAMHAYAVLVLGILAGTVGLPVPEELPLITAGVLAGLGVVPVEGVIAAGVIACFLGDITVYAIGRRLGSGLRTRPRFAAVLRTRGLLRARRVYVRHGGWTLFFARLLPGLKMPFLLTAGVLHMPWRRFLLIDLLSVITLVPALVLLGYHSTWSVPRLHQAVRDAGVIGALGFALAVLCALAAVLLVRARRRQMRPATHDVIETPAETWREAEDVPVRRSSYRR